MGFFKKKADPISERAKTLNQQIAALEAEIKRLSSQEEDEPAPKPTAPGKKADPGSGPPLPRLRSTALPHGHTGAIIQAQAHASPSSPPREQPLEDVNPFREQIDQPRPEGREEQLGVRKSDTPSLWQRIKNNFRAAPASNPKLLNYLAAGSIHGLRPLRYEKRVARNRFLLLVIVLAVLLWGIVAALLRK